MHAIILAAGRGSRMGKQTDDLPKCMLPLHGQPLINKQITALQQAGIKDIAVVCGYQKDKIQASGITHRFENSRWQESNMVRSLMSADSWLKQYDCIISYADIFYASSAITSLINSKAHLAVTYDVNFQTLWASRFADPLVDLETFKKDEQDNLLEIGKRPNNMSEVQGQYMGLLKFTPSGWRTILNILRSLNSTQIDKLDMTSLLQHVISAGDVIKTVPYKDHWGEVDHASDLMLYQQSFTHDNL